jgi:hypothetical protein
VFALHGEGSVPGPLAALTLGGTWNALTVPDSRTGALGWVALVALVGLAALGARGWWRQSDAAARRALLVCWGVGFGLALLTWVAPGAVGWLAAHVPGAGLVRDGARALVLCAPLLVVLVAHGVQRLLPRAGLARASIAVGAVLLPVALLPDLAWGVSGRLQPAHYPPAYAAARDALEGLDGDVLVLPLSSYRAPAWNAEQPVLDPVGRYLTPDYVASDVLVVDDVVLQGEDPRVTEAARALARTSPQARSAALAALGIGAVVTDPTAPQAQRPDLVGDVVLDTPDLGAVVLREQVRPADPPWTDRVLLGAAWASFLLGPALALGTLLRRRARR